MIIIIVIMICRKRKKFRHKIRNFCSYNKWIDAYSIKNSNWIVFNEYFYSGMTNKRNLNIEYSTQNEIDSSVYDFAW